MEPVPQDIRLARRAIWLIRLRWIAVIGVIAVIFLTPRVLNIPLESSKLYLTTLLLSLYNLITHILVKYFTKNGQIPSPYVNKIVNFQISADLLFLTVLLHFSGGIENPFVIYFIFHMIIASILLSRKESFIQATLAAGLVFLMTILEYGEIIPHYSLEIVPMDFHAEGFYVFSKAGVLASTFYLVVYMASSIAVQARIQENGYYLANNQLKEKDRIKDQYVARVTHDIKGHLAAIQSCLDVVESKMTGPLNEKQEEFISKANARTRKLTEFVIALLKLTRMRLNGEMSTQTFLVPDVIAKSIADAEIRAGEKSITIKDASPDNPGKINANKVSIEELITNLLYNAVKYTPKGGKVNISATDKGKYVQIEIADSGIGIPEDEIDHVFDEFYRATNARKTERDGTGLGLTLAKQIIEQHGGKISVKSKLNEGTIFTFTLAKNTGKTRSTDTFS